MRELTLFFKCWGIDLEHTAGLTLDLCREHKKSNQAMCFILEVPEDVYVLMNPEGGWVDLETLWHELGHGLSAVFTAPELSIVEKDMATSYSLSESFAFLLQNLSLSLPFLEDYLGLNHADSEKLFYHKVLKDLSIFRRYAAKFLTEYEIFLKGDLSNGNQYAEMMARYTGFYYQPESHLFDLVPEFYSLDYVMAWMAEAIMEDYMQQAMGSRWIFYPESGDILKKWWSQGNRYDVFQFMKVNDLGSLGPEGLLKRWHKILG
jgi:oligoendopeptidase F